MPGLWECVARRAIRRHQSWGAFDPDIFISEFRKIKRKLIVWINSGELSMESEVSVFLCEVYDKKIRGILFSYGGRRN